MRMRDVPHPLHGGMHGPPNRLRRLAGWAPLQAWDSPGRLAFSHLQVNTAHGGGGIILSSGLIQAVGGLEPCESHLLDALWSTYGGGFSRKRVIPMGCQVQVHIESQANAARNP